MRNSTLGLVSGLVALLVFLPCGGAAASSGLQCGDVVTGDVVLMADLTCLGDGLLVDTAADVILDLNGHSIVGPGTGSGTGIRIGVTSYPSRGSGAITIENGTIENFSTGLLITGAGSGDLRNLTIDNNGTGIQTTLHSADEPGMKLTDSTVSHNELDGVNIYLNTTFRMNRDTVTNNGGRGIAALDDSLRLIRDSVIVHNGGDGAYLFDTVADILGNKFLGNGGTGLRITDSVCQAVPYYLVSGNFANQNHGGGISFDYYFDRFCTLSPPGTGNAAQNNDVFQCEVIICAKNPGRAKIEDVPPLTSFPMHEQ